jgi:K+/H+ antiporter YhaU regulatory subunit KhtT
MREASEALYSLKPISFRYKPEFDSDRAERFGLIAEEVEKINPNLVTRNERGEIMTVRYDSVNAMLLNEFLKEHRVVQDQEKEIRQLRTELKQQQALIEKISDKIGVLGPAPRLVSSSR